MPRIGSAGVRKPQRELKPEFLILGLLDREPAHGYELYKAFGRELSALWRIGESQFYALIRRIEARGLVEARGSGTPRERRVLALTAEGRLAFEAWLAEPSPASPRILHVEFLSRLCFARDREPSLAARLAREQRLFLEGELARLEGGTPAPEELRALSKDFRMSQLRAALVWVATSVEPAFSS